jgi:hypothetical protein
MQSTGQVDTHPIPNGTHCFICKDKFTFPRHTKKPLCLPCKERENDLLRLELEEKIEKLTKNITILFNCIEELRDEIDDRREPYPFA